MAAALIIALFVAGSVVVWLIKATIGLLFYIIVGAIAVGAVVYLYGKAKTALGGGDRRQLP